VRILVLGGTRFLGPHVVAAAQSRGHEVTVFNRGTVSGRLTGVTALAGDRDGDLTAIEQGEWDAVVDTCGYVPRLVGASAALLAKRIGTYVLVSSASVYDATVGPVDELASIDTVEDETTEDVPAHYGALKALCEHAAAVATGGRSCAVRAGLIVGPDDPTGRFTYWPHRIARGGPVLLFDGPGRIVQVIDVRDLAAWIVGACEQGLTGPYNVTGREPALTMGELFETAVAVSRSDATAVWVSESFLAEHEVGEWMELPLWIDPATPVKPVYCDLAVGRAVAAGLTWRPLADTIAATLSAAATVAGVGLEVEREAALLAAWRERSSRGG
jgi:2'-hydroxyisoflavone reductase